MARQEIDLTTPQPDGKMGEPTKAAWQKVNDMTLELYASKTIDINVESFGVLANGVADDTDSFESIINTYGASGFRFVLPQGTTSSPRVIRITRPLNITSGSSPNWIGGGFDKTVIRYVGAALTNKNVFEFVGNPKGIRIIGIGFDQNGALSSSAVGMLGFQNPEFIDIQFCKFYGFDKMGLSMNGARNWRVANNQFSRSSASTSYNQAFLLSSSSRASVLGQFIYNECIKSGTDFDGSNIDISHNMIYEWSFGGGVTMEATSTTYKNRICDNEIYGSTGIDVNGYRPGGIENWGPFTVISGNRCRNNSGAGIDQGGAYCRVVENICYNNGKSGTPGSISGGDGIVSRYSDANYNANFSTYIGNMCFDSQGSKTQGYGYRDQSATLVGITLRANKYRGNLTGAESIISSSPDWAGPELNRQVTVNPPSITNGTQWGTVETVPGATLGDYVEISTPLPLQGLNLWGFVNANNAVTIYFTNNTGGAIDLASSVLNVKCRKPMGYTSYL